MVKIGRPGYRVTKQYDPETDQRSLLFQARQPPGLARLLLPPCWEAAGPRPGMAKLRDRSGPISARCCRMKGPPPEWVCYPDFWGVWAVGCTQGIDCLGACLCLDELCACVHLHDEH